MQPTTPRSSAASPAIRPPLAIVDDEPGITSALAAWARLNGIEPLVCGGGEALFSGLHMDQGRLCCRGPDGALLELGGALIDVGLPGQSGFEVAHALRRLAPRLPLVIMTAMNAAERSARGSPPEGVAVLQKPFELDALEDCLLAALDAGARGGLPAASGWATGG